MVAYMHLFIVEFDASIYFLVLNFQNAVQTCLASQQQLEECSLMQDTLCRYACVDIVPSK